MRLEQLHKIDYTANLHPNGGWISSTQRGTHSGFPKHSYSGFPKHQTVTKTDWRLKQLHQNQTLIKTDRRLQQLHQIASSTNDLAML